MDEAWRVDIMYFGYTCNSFDSLSFGDSGFDHKLKVFKCAKVIIFIRISSAIVSMSAVLNSTNDKSSLILGNSLVPSGNKSLPDPMSTKIYDAIWRH